MGKPYILHRPTSYAHDNILFQRCWLSALQSLWKKQEPLTIITRKMGKPYIPERTSLPLWEQKRVRVQKCGRSKRINFIARIIKNLISTILLAQFNGIFLILESANLSLNIRKAPSITADVDYIVHNGTFTVVGISADEKWYKLKSGLFIITIPDYVSFKATAEQILCHLLFYSGLCYILSHSDRWSSRLLIFQLCHNHHQGQSIHFPYRCMLLAIPTFLDRINLEHLDLICEALHCELDELIVRVPNDYAKVTHTRTYRGAKRNSHATIERKSGSTVPVLVWEIQPIDEYRLVLWNIFPYFFFCQLFVGAPVRQIFVMTGFSVQILLVLLNWILTLRPLRSRASSAEPAALCASLGTLHNVIYPFSPSCR